MPLRGPVPPFVIQKLNRDSPYFQLVWRQAMGEVPRRSAQSRSLPPPRDGKVRPLRKGLAINVDPLFLIGPDHREPLVPVIPVNGIDRSKISSSLVSPAVSPVSLSGCLLANTATSIPQ